MREDDENGLFDRFLSQLPHTLRYVCECVLELLHSIIQSAALVWGRVAFRVNISCEIFCGVKLS